MSVNKEFTNLQIYDCRSDVYANNTSVKMDTNNYKIK
jgi:hypothetical protein